MNIQLLSDLHLESNPHLQIEPAPGADLRKDIHSMKLVGCGAGGNSEQDKIDAHFEQVMSKIGQHR